MVAGKRPARAARPALSLTVAARCYGRGLRDFFSHEVLLVAGFPFVLVLLLFAAEVAAALTWLIPGLRAWLPPLKGDLLVLMIDAGLGLALAALFTFVNILVALTLIGVFFTERLVGYVNRTYYRRQLAPFAGNLLMVATSLRFFRKFLVLFLLLSPLYLVPGVNVIAFALPSYFYFRSSLLFDVGSQTVSRPAYEALLARHRRGLHLLLLPLFLLSSLPVIGIFASIYAFLVVTHFFLAQGEEGASDLP